MWVLLISVVVITYFIQRHRLQWVPPSSCAMLLGVLAGGISRLAGEGADGRRLRGSPLQKAA